MKKSLSIVITILCLMGSHLSAWAQASTEGKEFWVANVMAVRPPDNGRGEASPYIAVSAKTKKTKITISNPNTGWSSTQTSDNTQDNDWVVFDNIPLKEWYPTGVGTPTEITAHADKTYKYGLLVEAEEEVSVFVVVRANASMDASNILPTTALAADYIVQDYLQDSKSGDGEIVSQMTILATEDNTDIDIIPSAPTYGGKHAAGQKFTIKLNKGETYYLMSQNRSSISGTQISAKDEKKKIAVFQGAGCTRIPNGIGNRDCLYEQAMPTDYWGNEFVLTRSLGKDANFFKITAKEPNTIVYLNNKKIGTIPTIGGSFEIQMQNGELTGNVTADSKVMNNYDDITHYADYNLNDSICYLKTSCPVAVYCYEVGKSYTAKNNKESVGGDPSMVWISPIQQRINQITFGVCGTNLTKWHALNLVALTSEADKTTITPAPEGKVIWRKIAGTDYSAARIFLCTADNNSRKIYTISNPLGIIGHVYGHSTSDSEGYSYSIGSAAAKQGIYLNGAPLTDGSVLKSFHACVKDTVDFDASIGTDNITRVVWNFGDGTTADISNSTKARHLYDTKGWYDVIAETYGTPICSDEAVAFLGKIKISFYVQEPVVVNRRTKICKGEKWAYDGKTYDTPGTYTIDPILVGDCDSIINFVLQVNPVPAPVSIVDTMRNEGKVKDPITGEYYATDKAGTYVWADTILSKGQCDSIINHKRTIQTCLVLNVENPAFDCNSTILSIPFDVLRGEASQIQDVYYMEGKSKQTVTRDDVNRYFNLDIRSLHAGKYAGAIVAKDKICGDSLLYTVEFDVNYPKDIFTFKQTNVLAVKNSANNGGYEFIGYQWYRNGEKIEGATGSIYHTTEDFIVGDQYFVVLTDNTGRTLQSCPQTIWDKTGITAAAPQRAAEKLLKGQQMLIRKDNKIYDIYGNEIK